MKIECGESLESFQQKVWRAMVDGQRAFVKQFISDYSWWTFEESDIYLREKLSSQLLNAVNIGPSLLSYDDTIRQIVLQECPRSPIKDEDKEVACDNLLCVLKTLRSLRDTGLERLTAQRLAEIYTVKGKATGVHPQLVAEIAGQLAVWQQTYGDELCFTHGDLHPGNALFNGQHVGGIIDFEEAIESLPVFDAATFAYTIRKTPELYEYFRRGYENAFNEPLIPVEQWGRFTHLRHWIAYCYLNQCCAPDVREKARNFVIKDEPEIQQ